MFSAVEMRVENMRHIDIVMKKGYRTFTTEKHIRVFIQKTAHQLFRREIIFKKFRCRLNGIEKENPQIGRFALDQINIITEFHFCCRCVDRC